MSIGTSKANLESPSPIAIPQATPFSVQGISTLSSVSMAQAGANQLQLMFLDVQYQVQFNKIMAAFATPDNGVVLSDLGIYSLAGKLLANAGPGTNKTAIAIDFPILQGLVTLAPGRYIFAVTSNNNVGNASIDVLEGQLITEVYNTPTAGVGGALPPIITVVTVPRNKSDGSFTYATPLITLHQ